MIRIGVNLQALRPGEIGGLESYLRNLLRHIIELRPELEFVLFCADYNVASFAGQPGVQTRLLSPSEFADLDSARLFECDLDLWFCPLLVLEPVEPGLPSVVTIPDLQHEEFPEFFTAEILAWRREHYLRSAQAADHILTLSEYSKRHIVEHLSVGSGRVTAIHLDAAAVFSGGGADETPHPEAIRAKHKLPERFFYYPANTWPHKNHQVLFEAMAGYRDEIGDCPHLVLTGAEVESEGDWRRQVSELGLDERVRHLGFVPEEDLPGLYASSLALVIPSLFEGFGIPVVEAMRCGCPVLSSSATSLPEVGGDAVLYFEPGEPRGLVRKMLALTGDGGEDNSIDRHELIRRGLLRAQDFSWVRTARETLDVFECVLSDRSTSETKPELSDPPRITVITPSYNQGEFIERTLRSVLEQGYPNLQYLVMDGGSSDQTVEILERFRERYPESLSFVTEPDRGQAHAVNKGLARADGEIIGWLNSDDTYAPGALQAIASAFSERADCDVIYGHARYISEDDQDLGPYPTRTAFDPAILAHECFLCQPTVFMRKSQLDEGFSLDENLQTCMDYDLWIRLGRVARFSFLDRLLASSRMHPANKTMVQRTIVFDEVFSVVKRHYGRLPRSWALGRAFHTVDRGDPIFGSRRPTLRARIFAELLLVRHNWRQWEFWSKFFARAMALASRLRSRLRLFRSARELTVPGSWLGFHLEFTVSDQAVSSPSTVSVWDSDHELARVSIDGPGTYRQVVALPWQRRSGENRLQLRCEDGLQVSALDVVDPEPCFLAAEDGWLQKEDSLRIPREWKAVELAFMVPATDHDQVELRFGFDGKVFDRWMIPSPGEHRRRLTLPDVIPNQDPMIGLDFQSTAALAPDPKRGESRELAILLREAVPDLSFEAEGS